MAEVSRKEFNEAVVAAFTAVRSFHGQLALMWERIWEELRVEPYALRHTAPFPLWRTKGTEAIRVFDEYRTVFQLTSSDDYDEDELDEIEDGVDEDDEGEAKTKSKRKKKGPIEILPQQTMLAIRINLRDPRQSAGFEPHLLYVTLNDWGVGDDDWRPDPDDAIRVRAHQFRRLPKSLKKDLPEQQRKRVATRSSAIGTIKTKKRGLLSCTFTSPVHYKALYDLDGPNAIEQLTSHMKSLFTPTDGESIETK